MCLYVFCSCIEKVKTFARIVSFIIGLLVIIVWFTGMFIGIGMIKIPKRVPGLSEIDVNDNEIASAVMILGICVCIVFCLGYATFKYPKPWFAIPFAVFTVVIGIILLVVGILSFRFSDKFVDLVEKKSCSYQFKVDGEKFVVDELYNNFVSGPMCAYTCPCNP